MMQQPDQAQTSGDYDDADDYGGKEADGHRGEKLKLLIANNTNDELPGAYREEMSFRQLQDVKLTNPQTSPQKPKSKWSSEKSPAGVGSKVSDLNSNE